MCTPLEGTRLAVASGTRRQSEHVGDEREPQLGALGGRFQLRSDVWGAGRHGGFCPVCKVSRAALSALADQRVVKV